MRYEQDSEPQARLNLNPVREHDENLVVYHARLKRNARALHAYLRGRLVWDSARKGTYEKGM